MKVVDLILNSTYEWNLKLAVQEIPSSAPVPGRVCDLMLNEPVPMNRLLREYFFLLLTKFFFKKEVLISTYISISSCKSCRSFTSREWEPSLLQCHMLPSDACLSLWPHIAELFASIWCLGMAKSEWHIGEDFEQTESLSQGSCPDEQPCWLSRGQISFSYALLYIVQTFLFHNKDRRENCPSRYWAGILSLMSFIIQLFMSVI